jgi:hypothetical protein
MPYTERPVELPLSMEECRTAIWRCKGNISEAAQLLKITSLRLRTFVRRSPYLMREMEEAKDQLVDIAEGVVEEALTDEDDKSRRDTMARFVLNSSMARARGWGSGANPSMKINNTGGTIVVQWEDGTKFAGTEPNVIETDYEKVG